MSGISGGTARALNSRRRSKGLQAFAVLLACLGLYSLVTNVNPGRLQHFQVSYLEGQEDPPSNAGTALGEDDSEANNEPSYSPTNEPSYFPTNSPVEPIKTDFNEARPQCPIEKEGQSLAIDTLQSSEFHEQRCGLLKQHMSGHWNHYFSSYDNITTVIQNDPSIEQIAFPMTDEMLNDASIRLMHFPEEMDWLQGKGMSNFDMQCRYDTEAVGISYLSPIGNQCGCGMSEFQPTFSYWSYEDNNSSDLVDGEGNYKFMKNSPSVRLARRFAMRNQTVCFVGDSVDWQLYNGFKNNLHRAETLYKKKCGSSFLNISSTEYPAQYSTNGTMEDRKHRKRMGDGFWMLMNQVRETTVIFHDTLDEFRFRYLQHYMYAPWTYEYMNSCDVIMMNQALHYRLPLPNEELSNDVMAAITYLANYTATNDKVAIWRSALPVHFDTPTGHYHDNPVACVAHNDTYILQEGNELQEYTKVHKQAFAELCQTDTSSCGQLTHTCTVDTKSTDLFTVHAFWVANNMTEELELHENDEAIVTGTIHNWPLFDLFNTPMWHASLYVPGCCDCTHFCYIPALFEEAFKRLDLILSAVTSSHPGN